ncbi:MAG: cache domain-containing protein [Spirochaetes bacterium]|nr:cache domain-containing protein [Spirochaetota bacterium]
MNPATRVELHCHSDLSDGSLSPEALAERVIAAGAGAASLTDHDQIEGLPAFQKCLERHGVGFIAGVEISASHGGREVHLLGYGFNPLDEALAGALAAHRQTRRSASGTLQKSAQQGARYAEWEGGGLGGGLAAARAIRLVHDAGGKAFLAHPLALGKEESALHEWCRDLKGLGLDGLEVFYGPYPPQAIEMLRRLAESHGLLMSGGTDWHGGESVEPGVEIPHPRWLEFIRGCCFASPPPDRTTLAAPAAVAPPRSRRTRFGLRFVLPSLLALGLFAAGLFAVLLPAFEDILLERKRELIRELTRSARSIAEDREREVREGRLGPREAREQAKARIAALRYGREGKDYFWIQDLRARMVMHPWRPDLDGRDLSEFRDARGHRIFVAFADLVRERGEGYARYVWQWKDDPRRIAAKESYVLGFEPWGWILGTGMYTDDVREELARLERGLLALSLAIALLVGSFLAWLLWQSFRLERERSRAEERLRESHERFRALVEAAREGTLHVRSGRCQYANPTLLDWLGYRASELPLIHFRDLLPERAVNREAHAALEALERGEEAPRGCEALLAPRRGPPVLCALGFSRMGPGENLGFVVLVRLLSSGRGGVEEEERLARLARMADEAPLGLYRARLAAPGLLVAQNLAASRFMEHGGRPDAAASLADLFHTDSAYRAFHSHLTRLGWAEERLTARRSDAPPRILRLHARLGQKTGEGEWVDGTLHEIQAEDEAMARRLRQGAIQIRELLLEAEDPGEVSRGLHHARSMARRSAERDLPLGAVSDLMAIASDAAVERLLALAARTMGPSPAPFAFLALGSHGRKEQTPSADQDNALIYADLPPGAPDARPYFLRLAAFVCDGLARGGLTLCQGATNAMHAPWCRALGEWKETAASWIARSQPKDLMESALFFDFRTAFGDPALGGALQAFVHERLSATPAFYPRFAQNGLGWKAPVRLFGKRLGDESESLDYKRCLMPLIHGVRLYALREGIDERHTLDRLRGLENGGRFAASEHAEMKQAWETLTRLRLESQCFEGAREVDGGAPPAPVGSTEDAILLEHAFSAIEGLQRRLARDFLGA